MNQATLQRFYHGDVTFGELKLWFDHKPIYTIERKWQNNEPDVSCIPQGLYNVIPHNSIDHPNTYELLYVPNRQNILIHTGNYANEVIIGSKFHAPDTLGCLLVGLGYDKSVPMVKESVNALNFMRDNIVGNWCLEVLN